MLEYLIIYLLTWIRSYLAHRDCSGLLGMDIKNTDGGHQSITPIGYNERSCKMSTRRITPMSCTIYAKAILSVARLVTICSGTQYHVILDI